MKKIAVISGKGGTGKTMVSGALSVLVSADLVIADCDVDAANLELLLDPKRESSLPYWGLKVAFIDQDACVSCGSCLENCRFDAISIVNEQFVVNPIKCEGCGVCTLVCPSDAVSMEKRENGRIFYSSTNRGPLSHARLEPGSGTSGLLVSEVKKQALQRAGDRELLLTDGPPGIGCPVIATVSGMDAVIVVTEPSVSGLHDLKRVVKVAKSFGVEIFVIVNKHTLDEKLTREIEDYCAEQDIEVVGRIPFDPVVIEAIRNRVPVTDYDSPASREIRNIWDVLKTRLGIE